MKIVVQRVKNCSVHINEELYSSISHGLLLLFCVEKGDTEDKLDWMANKVLGLRMFEDENNKMNKSVVDISGQIMIVSQFTLAADCKKGTRPSFDSAEEPQKADLFYKKFIHKIEASGLIVQTGEFGAMMDVSLCNDGPVTFVLNK